ncbi:MAG TPA: helix-hairpin-helix domain-containing protein, partial [Thermoanaerobaculia bacterium]|nr:helix-hairpin-helix domain-containing protein [Thermoanaerobaculia bacterium]
PIEGAALIVFDLLRCLLDGDLDKADLLPSGATVAWPLIPGLTDSEELALGWLPRLAARGVARVRAFTLQLTQGQRRKLAERLPESAFAPLFHPPVENGDRERAWAQWISSHGMGPFIERPAVPLPDPVATRRNVAGVLLEVADMLSRLGRSPLASQAYFRAAREIEGCARDLEGMARDGNLGILPWLDGEAEDLVRGVLLGGSAPLLAALRRDYLCREVEA